MIEILRPGIFDRKKIQSGVTQYNGRMFPKYGLSLSPAAILSTDEYNIHLQMFAHSRGIRKEDIKFNKQIHSNRIRIVDKYSATEEADALITNEKELMLLVKIADCAAIIMYDTENEVIAAVHSGWRGTKQNITGMTIRMMTENFASKPANILSYISPAASVKNYEVGEEFLNFFPDYTVKRNKKYYFDNKKAIFNQLIAAGINSSSIEVSDICTIIDKNYHSYRQAGDFSGRMGAFIMLK
jgi:YfiH family protein